MKIWVMRHADAGKPIDDDPEAERERPLSEDGEELAAAVGKRLAKQDDVPKIIFASKYARTTQTADIIGGILGVGVDLIDECSPHMPLEGFLWQLLGDKNTKRVLFVGHSDNLIPALNEMDGGDADEIAKGEVRFLRMDRKSGDWTEEWRILPSELGFEDDYGR